MACSWLSSIRYLLALYAALVMPAFELFSNSYNNQIHIQITRDFSGPEQAGESTFFLFTGGQDRLDTYFLSMAYRIF
jgi:hypothetical protein